MTTIAYRAGVMASDTLAILGGTTKLPARVKKLYRLADGTLVGGAGDAHEIAATIARAEKVGDLKLSGGNHLLSVTSDGVVRMHSQWSCIVMDGPFAAIGDGTMAALAAMHMGASAKRAVEIACRVGAWTGGAVQTMRVRR